MAIIRRYVGTLSGVTAKGDHGFFAPKDWRVVNPDGEDDVQDGANIFMHATVRGPGRHGELRDGQQFEFNTRKGPGGRIDACDAKLVRERDDDASTQPRRRRLATKYTIM